MPEAVSTWIKTSSLDELSEVHNNLLNTYQDDFTKYSGKLSITHLEEVLRSVPKFKTINDLSRLKSRPEFPVN